MRLSPPIAADAPAWQARPEELDLYELGKNKHAKQSILYRQSAVECTPGPGRPDLHRSPKNDYFKLYHRIKWANCFRATLTTLPSHLLEDDSVETQTIDLGSR